MYNKWCAIKKRWMQASIKSFTVFNPHDFRLEWIVVLRTMNNQQSTNL